MEANIKYFRRYGTLIVAGSAVLHNIIFFGSETLFITSVLLYGWLLISYISVTSKNVRLYPVSTLMISGMALMHFVLPMPLMLLELKPMDFNLRVPFDTFFHHGIFVTTIVFTHFFYTNISGGKNYFRSALQRTAFYNQPSNILIWCTAIVGLLALFYNSFIYGDLRSDVSDRGFIYYISSIMIQYIWMPVIILFSKFRTGDPEDDRTHRRYIAGYVLIVSIVALSSNTRTLLFGGMIIVFSLICMGFLLGLYEVSTTFSMKKIFTVLMGVLIIGGPIVNFGYAMIGVRGERSSLSATDLITETLKLYNDEEALNTVRKTALSDSGANYAKIFSWDENYFDNILINRYVNFKISDNSVFYAEEIGLENTYVQDEVKAQIAALLPNIFLRLIGYDVSQKIDTASYSIGDYIYSVAINNRDVLGSFVVSSMPGIGLAIFGYWYPIIVFLLFMIIFPMFDSFAINHQGRNYFSYYFFVSVILIFNYFNDRHVYIFEFRYIIRTYLESVLVFLFTMFAFNSALGRRSQR